MLPANLDAQDTRFHTVRSSQGRELSNGDASVDSTSGDRSPPAALEQLADAAPAAPLAGVAAVGAGVASSLGLNSDTTTSSSAPAARDGSGSVLSNQTSSATSVGGEATLRKELAEARSEIERLKAQLGGGGAQLRQRTKGAGATGVTPSTTTAVIGHDVGVNPEAGVQLQTVAMLVFGTFVITWCAGFSSLVCTSLTRARCTGCSSDERRDANDELRGRHTRKSWVSTGPLSRITVRPRGPRTSSILCVLQCLYGNPVTLPRCSIALPVESLLQARTVHDSVH
jgi:hypothetical protein